MVVKRASYNMIQYLCVILICLYIYTHYLQDLIEELSAKLLSIEVDQQLFSESQRKLNIIYEEVFTAAVEQHGAKLVSDLSSLLNVSHQIHTQFFVGHARICPYQYSHLLNVCNYQTCAQSDTQT